MNQIIIIIIIIIIIVSIKSVYSIKRKRYKCSHKAYLNPIKYKTYTTEKKIKNKIIRLGRPI